MTRTHEGHPRKSSDPPAECSRCNERATMTEYVSNTVGATGFYAYCSKCWHEPGPNAPSPAERTGVPARSFLDAEFDRRLTVLETEIKARILSTGAALAMAFMAGAEYQRKRSTYDY